MKKLVLLTAVLIALCCNPLFSQDASTGSDKWDGTVKLNTVDLLTNALTQVINVNATWTTYLNLPSTALINIGLPLEVDVLFAMGEMGVSLGMLVGVEVIFPILGEDKSGIFIDAKVGYKSSTEDEPGEGALIGAMNAGYQFIALNGFVFAPTIGVKYDSDFKFNIGAHLGFAY
ncbi:MAG: hypothetical protein LBM77_04525 [Spirochaetaceae bacterium]|jgi:hypothetical protein|nr:hypothetical protein [Spirochaetaceae bacterium]